MRVLHISTFSPTQCGIATFTEDLIANLVGVESLKLRMQYEINSPTQGFFACLRTEDHWTYTEVARAINNSDVEVVSLQHEFGIFGGEDGDYVTSFVSEITRPIVATLHTTSALLTAHRKGILQTVVQASKKVVVLTEESAKYVRTELRVPATKVDVIRHGVPDVAFAFPESLPLRLQYNGALVLVSAGHVRPSKGYQVALAALAKLKDRGVHFVYLILGTSQPQWDKTGEQQQGVEDQIRSLGLQDHVVWVRRYLEAEELFKHIQAADVGLVPYTEPDQISSGILPLMLACGRPVVATKFDCAKSIANGVNGVLLVDINNPDRLCDALAEIAAKPAGLRPLMEVCYEQTRPWLWKHSAHRYREVFTEAISA
jgi:glycosyltransferase involved in cell wall biosynthesis